MPSNNEELATAFQSAADRVTRPLIRNGSQASRLSVVFNDTLDNARLIANVLSAIGEVYQKLADAEVIAPDKEKH
jgi:hypothetical protein